MFFPCKIFPQGFTTQQAEVLVKILVQMTNSNMEVIYNDMVTKVQQVRLFECPLSGNCKSASLLSLCKGQPARIRFLLLRTGGATLVILFIYSECFDVIRGCNTLCVHFEDEKNLVTSDFLIFKFTTIC